MKRFGQVLGIKRECIEEYRRYHVAIWPEIAHAISASGIKNYSIYLDEPSALLFSYFEYHGSDAEFGSRMVQLSRAPRMREWWDLMEAMQVCRPDRANGDWWTTLPEVFRLD